MNVGFVRGSTDPVAHSGKLCQVKATLRCKGRIGKQAELGGGEIVDQPLPALQMLLHAHQRSVSPLQQRGIDLAVCLAEIDLLETADSEGGFMAVLLPRSEEHTSE